MPIPSFDELFTKRADYFESQWLAAWEQRTKQKTYGHDTRAYILQICGDCIPNGSHDEDSLIQSLIAELENQGQLAFLWVHINEILTAKKSPADEFKYDEHLRNHARNALTKLKTTLLEEINILQIHIANQAFLCADLSGMPLVSMILYKADLRHANLSHCRFNNTSLAGANLKEADLGNADLTDVLGIQIDTGGTTVSGLFNINLRSANLSGAKYKHADIMAAETNPPTGHFHQTKFGILPDSYDKNPAEKQALENKIRESYAAVITKNHHLQYNVTFLKLIQASGFSPLTWGDRPEAFEEEYRKWTQRHAGQLVAEMNKTLNEILSPDNERGYMKSRSRDAFKNLFFKLKESRSGQLGELTRLKNTEDLTIDQIADGLLKVSSAIRLEDNKLRSELLNQIENACKHPDMKRLVL